MLLLPELSLADTARPWIVPLRTPESARATMSRSRGRTALATRTVSWGSRRSSAAKSSTDCKDDEGAVSVVTPLAVVEGVDGGTLLLMSRRAGKCATSGTSRTKACAKHFGSTACGCMVNFISLWAWTFYLVKLSDGFLHDRVQFNAPQQQGMFEGCSCDSNSSLQTAGLGFPKNTARGVAQGASHVDDVLVRAGGGSVK